ncbi:unnamed protein product [Oikopleura dioica]|uniref:Uncharacterized protein n=1 Tax=Oikopleura dioica TaxID=34765 RepID=E4YS67_OIKDI|nr:unnamed protein product [Oikopleura dioica]
MSNPNDYEYEIEYSFDGPDAFDVLASEVRELRQFYKDERRCRYAFEKEIEDKMKLQLENLRAENRSVENDLRAQIAEQQREIIRLKKINEEKEEKIGRMQEKMDIHIETVQVKIEDVKNELVQMNQKEENERNKDLSQHEIVALFENCMITPDSNRFHTHADVEPFLRALEAGFDNLKFRIKYLSPFNIKKRWKNDKHFFEKTEADGSTLFYPKEIYKTEGSRIIVGNYGLSTFIVDGKILKIVMFCLYTPMNKKV